MKLTTIALLAMAAYAVPANAADFLLAAHSSANFSVANPDVGLNFTSQTQPGGSATGSYHVEYGYSIIVNFCDDPRYSDGQNCGDSYVDTAIGDADFSATPTLKFEGISAPSSISGFDGWIDFTNNSDAQILIGLPDNVMVPSAPSPTPEPESWAMLLVGFGLAGSAMRWRKRTAILFARPG